MSKKRNEMSAIMTLKAQYENYPGKDVCNIFKEGWDAAIEHDERVLALVRAISNLVEDGKLSSIIEAREVLLQYQESVKK